MGFFSKLGSAIKKGAGKALGIATLIPGIGPAIGIASKAVKALGGAMNATGDKMSNAPDSIGGAMNAAEGQADAAVGKVETKGAVKMLGIGAALYVLAKKTKLIR